MNGLRGYYDVNQLSPGMAGTDEVNQLGPGMAGYPARLAPLPQYYPPPAMGEFEKGLKRGGLGTVGTLQAFAGQVAEPFSARIANELFDEANKTLNFGSELQPSVPTWDDVRDISTFAQYGLGKAGEALPSTVTSLGAAGLGGAVGLGARALGLRALGRAPLSFIAGSGSMLPQEGGEAALTMHNDPAAMARTTPWERLGLATAKGGVNAALEFTPEAIALRRAFGAPSIRRGFGPAIGEVGKGLAEAATGEAITEGLQEKTGQIFQGLANPQRETGQDWTNIREAMLGGAFGGAGMGAVGGATHALRSNIPEMPQLPQMPRLPETFEEGYDLGHRTAAAIDRAGRNIHEFVSNLGSSVNQAAKPSLEWTEAKQKDLEILKEDKQFKKALDRLPEGVQRAVVGALHSFRSAPNLLDTRGGQAANDDLNTLFGDNSLNRLTRRMQYQGSKDVAHLGPTAVRQSGDANAFRQISGYDEFGELKEAKQEDQGTDQEGFINDILPADKLGVNRDILSAALQNRAYYRYGEATPSNKTQADIPLRFTSSDGSMSPEEFMRSLTTQDNLQDERKITRPFKDEEITYHTKDGAAELPINPMALVSALSTVYRDQLGDMREGQTGQSGQRKGDLFMSALTTLMTDGISITGPDGKQHHFNVEISPEAKVREPILDEEGIQRISKTGEPLTRELDLPSNLLIHRATGTPDYTVGHYRSEGGESTFGKASPDALRIERELLNKYAPLEHNDYRWHQEYKADKKKYPFGTLESKILWKIGENRGNLAALTGRNIRNSVSNGLQAVKDDAIDIAKNAGDQDIGTAQNLIKELTEYLGSDGEADPSPAVKKLFKDNKVPLYTKETLTSEALKNAKGIRPQDKVLKDLEYWHKQAGISRAHGLLGEEEAADVEGTARQETANVPGISNSVWGVEGKPKVLKKWTGVLGQRVTEREKAEIIQGHKDYQHILNTQGVFRVEGEGGRRAGYFKTQQDAQNFIDNLPENGFVIKHNGIEYSIDKAKKRWPGWKEEYGEKKKALSTDRVSVINPETGEILELAGQPFQDLSADLAIQYLQPLNRVLSRKNKLSVVDSTPMHTEAETMPENVAKLLSEHTTGRKLDPNTPLKANVNTELGRELWERGIKTVGDLQKAYAGKTRPLTVEDLEKNIQVFKGKEYDAGTAATPGEGTTPVEESTAERFKGTSTKDKLIAEKVKQYKKDLEERGIVDDFGNLILPPTSREEKGGTTEKPYEAPVLAQPVVHTKTTTITQREGAGTSIPRQDYLEGTSKTKGEPETRAFVAPTQKDIPLSDVVKKAVGSTQWYENAQNELSRKELETLVRIRNEKGEAAAKEVYEKLKETTGEKFKYDPQVITDRIGNKWRFDSRGKLVPLKTEGAVTGKKGAEALEAEGETEMPDVLAEHAARYKREAKIIKDAEESAKNVKPEHGIRFTKSVSGDYYLRTRTNANADATIAIAVDFDSAGEKLTKRMVEKQKKLYVPVDYNGEDYATDEQVNAVVTALNKIKHGDISVNIAGNGIYTLHEKGFGDQNKIDAYTEDLLQRVSEHKDLKKSIISVRSGGQTGFDEAGAKAGRNLGIPTEVHAPSRWRLREVDETNKEKGYKNVYDKEKYFKDRFKEVDVSPVVARPENIASNAETKGRLTSGLGRALTNMTWSEYQVYDTDKDGNPKPELAGLKKPNPTGRHQLSAEGWYKANSTSNQKWNEALMQRIIEAKLRQYPQLVKDIDRKGGAPWIEASEHTVNKERPNLNWEGKGLESNFIKVLRDAYVAVKSKQPKPAPAKVAGSAREPPTRTVKRLAPGVHVTRKNIQDNPDTIYVFGDNWERDGKGGQAEVARGEPNAIGVATKRAPEWNDAAYLNDKDYEKNTRIIDEDFAKIPADKNVVIMPLGEGRAQLETRAPKTWAYLQAKIRELTGEPEPVPASVKEFDSYVKRNRYSAWAHETAAKHGGGEKGEAKVEELSREIREYRLAQIPELKDANIGVNGSTVDNIPDEVMAKLQAGVAGKIHRVMVGNHGVYVEFIPTKAPTEEGKEHFQYIEHKDAAGNKLYEQTKKVNYANYRVGAWYVAAEDILKGKPAAPTAPTTTGPVEHTTLEGLSENRKTRLAFTDTDNQIHLVIPNIEADYKAGFQYMFGDAEHGTPNSAAQKRIVAKQMGLTQESFSAAVSTLEAYKKFLLAHEQSHVDNNDRENYPKKADGSLDLLNKKAVDIEKRATQDGLNALKGEAAPTKAAAPAASTAPTTVLTGHREPMYFSMPASENVTGKATTTFQLIKDRIRTATTRRAWKRIPQVGEIIHFHSQRDPSKSEWVTVEVTNVSPRLKDVVLEGAKQGKSRNQTLAELSVAEGWTAKHFQDEYAKGQTVGPESRQVTYKLVEKPEGLKESRQQIETPGVADQLRKVMESNGFVYDERLVDALPSLLDIAGKTLNPKSMQQAAQGLSFLMVGHPDFQAILPELKKTALYAEHIADLKGTQSRADLEAARRVLASLIEKNLVDRSMSEGLLNKIRRLLQKVWNTFNDKIAPSLTKSIDAMVDKALGKEGYLARPDKPGYKEVNFQNAVNSDKLAGQILKVAGESDAVLTGTLAYASQTKVYRPPDAAIHDLDFVVKSEEQAKTFVSNIEKVFPDWQLVRRFNKGGVGITTIRVPPTGTKFSAHTPAAYTLVDTKTGKAVGFFSPTKQMGQQAKAVDIFFNPEQAADPTTTHNFKVDGEDTSIKVVETKTGVAAKLRMLREKDLWDYQRYNPAETPSVMESRQAQPTPGWDPERATKKTIIERMEALAEKMFGRKIQIVLGVPMGEEKSGARGWYESRSSFPAFKANVARIKEVRQERRDALARGDRTAVDAANAEEASLLKQNEVVGTIYLNPTLANREMFPTYYHEALHAAFDILLTPAEKAVLATAFSHGTVRRQLEKIFANDPAVLKQMQGDPEEAAAFGFQIYSAAPHLLQLGPKVEGMFTKVAKWFKKMLGALSPQEKAQIIMDEMLSGKRQETGLSPLQRFLDKDATVQQKIAKHATVVKDLLTKLWEVVATPSYDRLIKTGNPSLIEFAKLGHTKTGEKGKLGMIQRMQNEISARFNWVNKITKKYTEDQIREVAEHRMNGTTPTDPVLVRAYNDIDTFFNEFRKYAKEAKMDIGFIKNYWPMLWDAEKVMRGREEFLKMITQQKYASYLDDLKVTPTELWENISGYVTRGDSFQGIMSPTGEPVNAYSRERSLSFLSPEDRKPFMHDSPVQTMVNYVSHMVRQAEFVRAVRSRRTDQRKVAKRSRT